MADKLGSRYVANWWPLAACGVIAGVFADFLIGALFQLVLVLVTRATSPAEGDSPAIYATWPLYGKFLAAALSPRSLAIGAGAGVLIAAVLWRRQGRQLATLLLCGLAFAAFRLIWQIPWLGRAFSDSYQALNLCLGIVGDIVRGSILSWVALSLNRRWSAR